MSNIVNIVLSMLGVGALFVLFGYLRPGEACSGHCRSCTSGCATKRGEGHE
jgi:hypothetical protein